VAEAISAIRPAVHSAAPAVVIQGFGTVGRGVAVHLAGRGYRVVAVADRLGTISRAGGLPVDALVAATDPTGLIDRAALPADVELGWAAEAWLDVTADILVLAAGGAALRADNVDRVKAGCVVEGANHPCDEAALRALADRAVPVVPGMVANAGAAIATGLVLSGLAPHAKDADALAVGLHEEVRRRIRAAFEVVGQRAAADGTSLPRAATWVAAERVAALAAADARGANTDQFGMTDPAEKIDRRENVMTVGAQDKHETVRQVRDRHADELKPSLDHAPVGMPTTRLTDPLPEALPPDEFVKQLTDEVTGSAAANIGPFYERLIAEQIPLEGVQEWVKQWYIDSRMFPSVIAHITANAGYFYDARQFMGANLAEELGEFNPAREHPVTVRNLGRGLGVSEEEMEFAEPYPETLLYVEYRNHLVRDFHWLEGLAAGSFAIELTIPNRFRQIARALSHQFGLDDEALEVFRIHAGDERLEHDYGGDDKHAEEAASLLRKYAVTAEMQQRIRLAIWRSIQARRVYQWGLYREIILKRHPAWETVNTPA
jgi:pyrroloquinoline quinone (PQQ) biosynthesis protein C